MPLQIFMWGLSELPDDKYFKRYPIYFQVNLQEGLLRGGGTGGAVYLHPEQELIGVWILPWEPCWDAPLHALLHACISWHESMPGVCVLCVHSEVVT